MVCSSALVLLASFALVFSLIGSLIGFPWVSLSVRSVVCPLIVL